MISTRRGIGFSHENWGLEDARWKEANAHSDKFNDHDMTQLSLDHGMFVCMPQGFVSADLISPPLAGTGNDIICRADDSRNSN